MLLPIHWGTFHLEPHAYWRSRGEWDEGTRAEEAGQAVGVTAAGRAVRAGGEAAGGSVVGAVSGPIARPWGVPEC
ncbi:hypothetical protein GCM10023238_30490 [Streptomyces heliomycini]